MVLRRLTHIHYCLLTALRKPGILPRQMSGLPVRFIICSLAVVPSSGLSLSGLWALDTCLPLGLSALNTCPSLGASRHQTRSLPLGLWAPDTCSPFGPLETRYMSPFGSLGSRHMLSLWASGHQTHVPLGPLASLQIPSFQICPQSLPNSIAI